MTDSLTAHLAIPIADEADARETAKALEAYEFGRITAVHVIEKGAGVPDKLSLEQAEERGEKAITAFRDVFPAVNAEVTYRRDVVEAICDVAAAVDASAIAFRPRGGSRLVQFLSGDTALGLVTDADRPVIALPDGGETE